MSVDGLALPVRLVRLPAAGRWARRQGAIHLLAAARVLAEIAEGDDAGDRG